MKGQYPDLMFWLGYRVKMMETDIGYWRVVLGLDIEVGYVGRDITMPKKNRTQCNVHSIITSKQIELESLGCSGFEGNSNTFPTIIYFLMFHLF